MQVRHGQQWHFAAVGGANAEVLQALDGAAGLQRVAHHDFHVLACAGQPLHFFTKIRLTHLTVYIGQGKPKLCRTGFQFDANFLRGTLQVVAYVVQAFVGAQLLFQVRRRCPQHVEVGVANGKFETGAAIIERVLHRYFFRVRDIPEQLAQSQRGVLGRHVTQFRRRQFDNGHHAVATGAGIPVFDQYAFAFCALIHFLLEAFLRVLKLCQYFQCAAVGRAFRHDHIDNYLVGLDFRHKAFFHPAATEHTEANHHHRDKDTQGQVSAIHRPLADPAVVFLGKIDNAVGNAFLDAAKTAESIVGLVARFQVAQVRRKDKQGFDQREQQRENHNPGDVTGEFAGRATNENPW